MTPSPNRGTAMTRRANHTPPATLSSNGVAIPVADTFAPMRDSTALLGSPDVLRERFFEDGYVLLRGVVERRSALQLRAAYFARFHASMFAAGTSPGDGVFSGTLPEDLPDYGTSGHPAYDFVRTEQFDEFTRDPALRDLAGALLDAPAELTPRRILRHFHRGSGKASRAHVDYDYMSQGTDRLVTMWIPLGDCPIECGGLVYLQGSHRVAPERLDELRPVTDRPHDHRPISHDLGLTARTLGGRWLWTDYAAGDVVVHSPHLVHASLDNVSDVMRLSADLRFHPVDQSADARWNQHWSADDGF
jgi:Phytanoyl-CoA dioxygenase (PhyH)